MGMFSEEYKQNGGDKGCHSSQSDQGEALCKYNIEDDIEDEGHDGPSKSSSGSEVGDN